ncbi:MAG: tagatose 1,6-diphosphate aldolase [Chloroflexota bacterium]
MAAESVGKVRGLQQIANPDGVFTICAMDHRDSMVKMLEEHRRGLGTYERVVERKVELCAALAPHASAVLLDPRYGVAQCLAAGVLPGGTGLLVSIEDTGYEGSKEARFTTLLPGWSVEKIRRIGASAVKILVYYRPDLEGLAAKQRDVVKSVAGECVRHDIPFLVETKSYAVGEELRDGALFAQRKPRLVIDTARQVTGLPLDVLKAEFPAEMDYERDEGKLLGLCRELDTASRVPWVLLSAGVDYETFLRQVELACKAGASGFLGGRAIWQEAFRIGDKKERVGYLSTTVVDRLKRLTEVASRYAVPWHRKLKLRARALLPVAEGWHERY